MAVENTMIHEIDVLRWLLGENYTSAEVKFPRKSRHSRENLQDPQIMYLTTESGVLIDVEAWVTSQYGYDIRCEVCCEEGTVSLPEPAYVPVRTQASAIRPVCTSWKERFNDAYNTEIQMWIRATKEGRVDGPNSWDGYAAQFTADAASRARDSQTIVRIDLGEAPELYR
jgi:myo-inositol 2-dehydrogenase / D-chiro-inositol 1-dehydrogenase